MSYKKAMKIMAVILVVIVILITAAGIFIKSYFTSEKIKGIVLPHAEKALGRKLSIKDINVSILTGIEIADSRPAVEGYKEKYIELLCRMGETLLQPLGYNRKRITGLVT